MSQPWLRSSFYIILFQRLFQCRNPKTSEDCVLMDLPHSKYLCTMDVLQKWGAGVPRDFFQISPGFFFRIRGLYSKTHKARSSNHAERVRAPTFFQHGKVAILWSRLCCELQYHHNWRTITYFHLSSTMWGAFYFLILHAMCSEKVLEHPATIALQVISRLFAQHVIKMKDNHHIIIRT